MRCATNKLKSLKIHKILRKPKMVKVNLAPPTITTVPPMVASGSTRIRGRFVFLSTFAHGARKIEM